MTGQSYPIATIEQMAQIPEDAVPRFLEELPGILSTVRNMIAIHSSFNAAFKGVGELSIGVPKWIDDDKRTRTVSLSTVDGEELFSCTTVLDSEG